ncbi:putative transmembrane protein [Paraburkholderia caribensis]|nr:putative transmembrane protein [Paraburkholderia caribensis]
MDFAGVFVRMGTLKAVANPRASRRAFFGVAALVFVAAAALTVAGCVSMQTMSELPMPGGWSMSMTWAPMCGQKWPRVAATFVGMWMVMMVAMMLPSLAPVLWRYHEAMGEAGSMRASRMTALAGVGYFSVWAVLGVIVFVLGVALMSLALRMPSMARAVPVAAACVVLLAGIVQFSRWKSRYLACGRMLTATHSASKAWTGGMRLGVHCILCCAGLTAVLLVNGTMDLRAMACVTLAITAERLAPFPDRIARATGAIVVVRGLWMLLQAS